MTLRLLTFKQLALRTPIRKIRRIFDEIAEEEAEPDWRGCVHLVFTSDPSIRKLNARFRNKDKATDVLSFNLEPPNSPDSIYGEIYISVTTARRQASEYRGTLTSELLRLFTHGLLHLYGYDHQTSTQRKRMQGRENYFLTRVGEKFKI